MISPFATLDQRCRADIETLLSTYSAHTGVSATSASHIILGDRSTFYRLVKAESGFRVPTYDAIVARFRTIWPDDLPWPEHVPVIREADVRGTVPAMRVDDPDEAAGDGPAAAERARLAELAHRLGIARPAADAA